MANEMNETELNEVAGGFAPDVDWEYVVKCSCGYKKNFKSFVDATKALVEHCNNNKAHNCSMNVTANK